MSPGEDTVTFVCKYVACTCPIGVMPEEAAAIRARLAADATVLESASEWLHFEDPFGFRWVVQPRDALFRSSGEIAGR